MTGVERTIIENTRYPILFEEEYWRLNKVTYYEPSMIWSFISHLCPSKEAPGHWRWSVTNQGESCPGCHQFPSDDLIALYRLHNWDRLAGKK